MSAIGFQSCKSSASQEDSENLNADDSVENDEYDSGIGNSSMRHPQKANAWATRMLVNTSMQQPQDKISECIEQISAIAKDSGNQDDMAKAVSQTRALVSQNLPLYHHCYYQIAARLDDRLAKGGALMTDMAYQFFESTKAMWIMARALDEVTGKKLYFSYLKSRYIQISRDTFGRKVGPIGSGFDDKTSAGGGTTQPQSKAAGSVLP